MSEPRDGTIVTFYSYKGGTGRTTALANVAWILAQAGNRVLAVDWDLEAPGLHKYFEPFLDPGVITATAGMIELISDYTWAAISERVPGTISERVPDTTAEHVPGGHEPLAEYARVLPYTLALNWDFSNGGDLHFVSAGRQNRSYSSLVSSMDWDNFYENLRGGEFFSALRADMKRHYDYVLIDSRTGFTDIADICTIQMPDILVDCFTLSAQSIEGATAVARHIEDLYRSRAIKILPVPMRIEDAENEKLEAGRALARARFAGLPRDMNDEDASRYWLAVEVPYRPFYAFEEILATFGDPPGAPSSLLAAYERLTGYITGGQVAGYAAIDEDRRLATLRAFARHRAAEDVTQVVLSYASADRPWADWVSATLEKGGLRVLSQCADRERTDFVSADEERTGELAIAPPQADAPVTAVLVLLSPAYARSEPAQAVWSELTGLAGTMNFQGDLLPVRVRDIRLQGVFAGITPTDLFGLSEQHAAERLLGLFGRRAHLGSVTEASDLMAAGPRFPAATGKHQIWNVPARNARFTGRAAALEDIRTRILEGNRQEASLPLLLYGLAGVGKTQLALEYAWRFRTEYDIVWWISAEEPAQVTQGLAELAQRMGREVGADVHEAAAAACDALRMGTPPYSRWLLIFDNAIGVRDLTAYLPGGDGHVIIASRSPGSSRFAMQMEVRVFSVAESERHLRDRVPSLTAEQARAISVELGCLPLAVEQAAATLRNSAFTPEQYLSTLDRELTRVLEDDPPDDYARSVASTWTVAFQELAHASPGAARMLQLCAFLAPEPVSLELIYGDEMAALLAAWDPVTSGSPPRAVRELTRFALARLDQSNHALQVHRLVQAVVRARMGPAEQNQACRDVHSVLLGEMPDHWTRLPGNGTDDPENWPRFDLILPHVRPSRAVDLADEPIRQMLVTLVRYQWKRNLFREALDLGSELDRKWAEVLGHDEQYLYLQAQLANVLRSQGRYQEAHAKDARTYELQLEILGRDNLHTLITGGGLAADLRALGQYKEALNLDKEVHERITTLLGTEHPRALSAANNLAVSHRLMGDIASATALDAATLAARQRVLGEGWPETLHSTMCLALDYREAGDFSKSVELLRETVRKYRDVLGERTLESLRATKSLSVSLRRGGHREEARKLMLDTCNAYDQAFPETPDARAASVEQASCLSAVGDKEAARTLAEVIFRRQERELGQDHPYTLAVAVNLTNYLRGTGESERAIGLGNLTMGRLRARLGEAHPFVLMCAVNLANALADFGRHRDAEQLERTTLQRLIRVRGEDHPDTLACQANLSITLAEQGQEEDANRLRETSLAKLQARLGDSHPAVADVARGVRLNRDLESQPI